MEGLKQAGQPSMAVIGLAKARGEKEERIFLPGRKNPILLRANSPATHLVQRVRDEAHRFALTFHRKLRSKALLASQLDQIIGVGEIRRASLLRRFKTLEGLAAASDEDLRGTGLSTQTIHDLRTQLGTKTGPIS
jgi:excinuclease ABC subunit C